MMQNVYLKGIYSHAMGNINVLLYLQHHNATYFGMWEPQNE